jgi:hypothetical protein
MAVALIHLLHDTDELTEQVRHLPDEKRNLLCGAILQACLTHGLSATVGVELPTGVEPTEEPPPSASEIELWTRPLPARYDVRTLKELWRNLTGMTLVEDSAFLEELRIQNNWMGLAEPSSRSTEYRLLRDADYLKGYRISASGRGCRVADNRGEVQPVPEFVVRYVLALLENIRLYREAYRPYIACLDDYPLLRMQLLVGEHLIEFFSRSQGEDHVPWAVVCGEGRWVTYSTAPSRALAALMPFLRSSPIE